MHILVTNDDGPPDASASPYIASFVRALQKHHQVSVVLPSQQRSWIGKAHLLPPSFDPKNQGVANARTDLIQPTYYYPSTGDTQPLLQSDAATTSQSKVEHDEHDEPWLLVPGTPATCVQLGLYHLFKHKGPIDLVVSGPNHGRNTTAAFGLSSGTLGGALEAAICTKRAIALSYAFFTRKEPQELVDEAHIVAVKVIDHLASNWGVVKNQRKEQVDVYSVNVPLVNGIEKNPVRWTWMLDNKWGGSSLYQEVDAGSESTTSETKGDGNATTNTPSQPRQFKWAPTFASVWDSVEKSSPGNDGWAIREQCTSVTPLRANFMHAGTFGDGVGDELKL